MHFAVSLPGPHPLHYDTVHSFRLTVIPAQIHLCLHDSYSHIPYF